VEAQRDAQSYRCVRYNRCGRQGGPLEKAGQENDKRTEVNAEESETLNVTIKPVHVFYRIRLPAS
jgi:hypothetical protein